MRRPRRRPPALGALVALLALAAFAEPRQAQAPLRLMSFNIRYGTAPDGANAWPNRRTLVVETIADLAPHVLGVQEALAFQLDELRAALGQYTQAGVGRDDGARAGEHAAILVDTSRLEVIAEGTFWLSDTPDVPGSMHWGNRITRVTTWVRLVDRQGGDTLRVYNLHWDHESQPSRERSAALLLERIERDAAKDGVLVLGDFNAGPTNPAFRALLRDPATRLTDAHELVRGGQSWPGTFHGFRGDRTGEKIDAILVGAGWQVLDAGVDERQAAGRWASDHFAVWAMVRRVR